MLSQAAPAEVPRGTSTSQAPLQPQVQTRASRRTRRPPRAISSKPETTSTAKEREQNTSERHPRSTRDLSRRNTRSGTAGQGASQGCRRKYAPCLVPAQVCSAFLQAKDIKIIKRDEENMIRINCFASSTVCRRKHAAELDGKPLTLIQVNSKEKIANRREDPSADCTVSSTLTYAASCTLQTWLSGAHASCRMRYTCSLCQGSATGRSSREASLC